MAAERKRRKKKRSARYRIVHNFKRSHRRRLKKHADATALLRQNLLAVFTMDFVLTAEQQLDVLFPGARLPRVREAMKRIERACGNLEHIGRTAITSCASVLLRITSFQDHPAILRRITSCWPGRIDMKSSMRQLVSVTRSEGMPRC